MRIRSKILTAGALTWRRCYMAPLLHGAAVTWRRCYMAPLWEVVAPARCRWRLQGITREDEAWSACALVRGDLPRRGAVPACAMREVTCRRSGWGAGLRSQTGDRTPRDARALEEDELVQSAQLGVVHADQHMRLLPTLLGHRQGKPAPLHTPLKTSQLGHRHSSCLPSHAHCSCGCPRPPECGLG